MSSIYLDTAIAVFFVFLLFSVIGYVVQEWWAALKEKRAKMLEVSLHVAFNDKLNKDFGTLMYEHPQIDLLREEQNRLPSYIPAENFASALIDLVGNQSREISFVPDESGKLKEVKYPSSDKTDSLEHFRDGVTKMNYSDVKLLLESFLANTSSQRELRTNIEGWFNRYMDRVSGWYRRDVRASLRVIAAILVVVFNIDALYLVQTVFQNSQLRASLIAGAENVVDNPSIINDVISQNLGDELKRLDTLYASKVLQDSLGSEMIEKLRAEKKLALIDSMKNLREKQFSEWMTKINSYGLPIGWDIPDSTSLASAKTVSKSETKNGNAFTRSLTKVNAYFLYWQNRDSRPGMPRRTWLSILTGWALAAICISFGAPFWFNLLSRLVPIRRSGIKPQTQGTNDTSNVNK